MPFINTTGTKGTKGIADTTTIKAIKTNLKMEESVLDDFFTRALLGAAGLALVTGPLGCLIIWRRMAWFGDTLAHSALPGIALGIFIGAGSVAGILFSSLFIAGLLLVLKKSPRWSPDSLLGLLSHSSLALGIIALTWLAVRNPTFNIDPTSLFFGDILAITPADIGLIYIGVFIILAIILPFHKSLIATTISPDIARAEGMSPQRAELILILTLALTIAMALKIAGVLLITALLIIPAMAARPLSTSPEGMMLMASFIALLSALSGLFASLLFDWPPGPAIVTCGFGFFLSSFAIGEVKKRLFYPKKSYPKRPDSKSPASKSA